MSMISMLAEQRAAGLAHTVGTIDRLFAAQDGGVVAEPLRSAIAGDLTHGAEHFRGARDIFDQQGSGSDGALMEYNTKPYWDAKHATRALDDSSLHGHVTAALALPDIARAVGTGTPLSKVQLRQLATARTDGMRGVRALSRVPEFGAPPTIPLEPQAVTAASHIERGDLRDIGDEIASWHGYDLAASAETSEVERGDAVVALGRQLRDRAYAGPVPQAFVERVRAGLRERAGALAPEERFWARRAHDGLNRGTHGRYVRQLDRIDTVGSALTSAA